MKKLTSLVLILALILSTTVMSFAAGDSFQNQALDEVAVDGYNFKIVKTVDDVKVTYEEDGVEYVATLDKNTHQVYLDVSDNAKFMLKSGVNSRYNVKGNYTEETGFTDLRLAYLDPVSNNYTEYTIVSQDTEGQVAPLYALPIGLGLTEALLKALLAASLAYLISDIAYVLAEEVASNVKKSDYNYFEARLMYKAVYVGNGISKSTAKGMLSWNRPAEGVMAKTDSYARGLCSGLGGYSEPEIHGSSGYWYHYHPKNFPRAHCWFY